LALKKQDLEIKSKFWFEKEGKPIFGEGRYRILKAVESEGSISKAAKKLDMSFRYTWYNLDRAEKNLGIRLLEREKGGTGGGKSFLTAQARFLMEKYDQIKQEVEEFIDMVFDTHFSLPDENSFRKTDTERGTDR